MTKRKATKHALLVSGLALLLCVSMLVGSTYAWFTDSVTSTGNIIKSGTLDVEMHWAEGKTDPDNTIWTDASTGAIFNNDKWEPGYVEVRHIKIGNAGTLSLKYQLHIFANGDVSKLADAIDVYFVDPAAQIADRTALNGVQPIGTLTEVLAGMPKNVSGDLAPNASNVVTLALKMQENAVSVRLNRISDKHINEAEKPPKKKKVRTFLKMVVAAALVIAIGTNIMNAPMRITAHAVVLASEPRMMERPDLDDYKDRDAWKADPKDRTPQSIHRSKNNQSHAGNFLPKTYAVQTILPTPSAHTADPDSSHCTETKAPRTQAGA